MTKYITIHCDNMAYILSHAISAYCELPDTDINWLNHFINLNLRFKKNLFSLFLKTYGDFRAL